MSKQGYLDDFIIKDDHQSSIEITQITKGKHGFYSDTSCLLVVKNMGFSSRTEYFSFHSHDYFRFLNDLSKMYETLKGSTELKSYDYPGFIHIEVLERGYFFIKGEITQRYDINLYPAENKHQFSFSLDQTCFERIARKYKGIDTENWERYFYIDD